MEHTKSSNSAIFTHRNQCQFCNSSSFFNNFKILSKSRFDSDNTIKESLLIKELQPSLNTSSIQSNNYILNVFN